MSAPKREPRIVAAIRSWLSYRFALRHDQAEFGTIDRRLRDDVEFRGTSVWLLIIATLVASVGLNVNSTAVIIGAMLISPLMGPIMGIGYGVGLGDFSLIKRAFRALAVAVLVSLIAATFYFVASPLREAQSELLGRTHPTLWDVVIALFGGLAGAVGATRKERSNVLPGVAIATALMPPLCTAGFGLAHLNLYFFLGALYLFFINSVFIAIATVFMVKLLRMPRPQFQDEATARRVRRYVYAVVGVTLLPSVYMTVQLVQTEVFRANAKAFLAAELQFEGVHVTDERVDPKSRQIEATLLGEPVSAERLRQVEQRLLRYGLADTRLRIYQFGDQKVDLGTLKTSLLGDLYRESQRTSADKDAQIQQLHKQLGEREAAHAAAVAALQRDAEVSRGTVEAQLRALDAATRQRAELQRDVAAELMAQLPLATAVTIAQAEQYLPGDATPTQVLVALVATPAPPPDEVAERLRAWLRVRTKRPAIELLFHSPEAAKPAASPPARP